MSAERVTSVEKIDWMSRAVAVVGFIAGLAIIQKHLLAGAAVLFGSWWAWNHGCHVAKGY